MSCRISSKLGLPKWWAMLAWEPVKKLSMQMTWAQARQPRRAGQLTPRGGRPTEHTASTASRGAGYSHAGSPHVRCIHQSGAGLWAVGPAVHWGAAAGGRGTHVVAPGHEVVYQVAAQEAAAAGHCGRRAGVRPEAQEHQGECCWQRDAPSTRLLTVTGFALISVLSPISWSERERCIAVGDAVAIFSECHHLVRATQHRGGPPARWSTCAVSCT